jgi:hypothetical protein
VCIRLGDPPQPSHVATAQCCSTPVLPHAVFYSLFGLQIVRRAGLGQPATARIRRLPCRTCRQCRAQARCCVSLRAKCLRGTGMHATASHKCLRGTVTCNVVPAGAACGEARSNIASEAEGAHDYTRCTRHCLPRRLRGVGTLWRRPTTCPEHRGMRAVLLWSHSGYYVHTSPRCTV